MLQAKPCWFWSGVAELASSGRDAPLRDPVAKLPVKKSSDEQIVDYLADLRDHFHRWLHQDEFGPDRKQQTASLRALMKSFDQHWSVKIEYQFVDLGTETIRITALNVGGPLPPGTAPASVQRSVPRAIQRRSTWAELSIPLI
jgi:hypothetical protein